METAAHKSELIGGSTALVPNTSSECNDRLASISVFASASSREARRRLPFFLASRYQVLPLCIYASSGDDVLSIVSSSGLSDEQHRELRFVSGCELAVEVFPEKKLITQAIEVLYSADGVEEGVDAESLIARAFSAGASDIHLEPCSQGYRCRLRISGTLVGLEINLSSIEGEKILRQFATKCRLSATRPGTPRDGGFVLTLGMEQVSLRCSFMPQLDGEKLVCRILADKALGGYAAYDVLDSVQRREMFGGLGLESRIAGSLYEMLSSGGGAFIVCGPTGSGKTTLLHACILALDRRCLNVASLEFPVERRLSGVSQVEYGEHSDTGRLLASMLRQDIDALLIGEIRDVSSASLFFHAAATGHQLYTTIHSANCIEAVLRLARMGVDFADVAVALKGLASSRLLPFLCPYCSLSRALSPEEARMLKVESGTEIKSASGCSHCQNTGVRGRHGVYEFLFFSPSLRLLLGHLKQPEGGISLTALQDFIRLAVAEGYRPLRQQVRRLLFSGNISLETYLRNH
ncbi:MAG: ATPase, T2SS/T4P/T4SS family [bacterium]|nr:ATPase, T2SS/T4P/T4SS family [bacterium]